MSSIFTRIIRRETPANILWENDDIIAILDINPIDKGHVLVIPKIEEDSIFNLSPALYRKLWQSVHFLEQPIRQAIGCPRVGLAVEGFGVPHVHIHMVPVYKGQDLNPHRAKPASADDLLEVADSIRKQILNAEFY